MSTLKKWKEKIRLVCLGLTLFLLFVIALGGLFCASSSLYTDYVQWKINKADSKIVAMRATTPKAFYQQAMQKLQYRRAELVNRFNKFPLDVYLRTGDRQRR